MIENICGINVEIIRKRNKNLIIKVGKDGKVTMTVPYRLSISEARSFFVSKLSWVSKKRLSNKPAEKTRCNDGDLIYVFGEKLPLKVYSERGKSCVSNSEISVFIGGKTKPVNLIVTEILTERLKFEAEKVFSEWRYITGLSYSSVTIRKTVSRWGSCNHFTKRINLSFYLVNLPIRCLKYVALHELGHTLYNNHGSEFKNFLTTYMPEWKTIERFMKENGESYKFIFLDE